MARQKAQRKRQKFSDLKYILLCLFCILSHSFCSLQSDEFAFEHIDYDHPIIATPSQNLANTRPPRMVSQWTCGQWDEQIHFRWNTRHWIHQPRLALLFTDYNTYTHEALCHEVFHSKNIYTVMQMAEKKRAEENLNTPPLGLDPLAEARSSSTSLLWKTTASVLNDEQEMLCFIL